MKMPKAAISLLLLISSLVTTANAQDNWPRFRGQNGNGVVKSAQLPATWESDDYLWKIKLPGVGSSSPVVWNDKLFISACDPETAKLQVVAVDVTTGTMHWQKSFDSTVHRVHSQNSFASSTMAVDESHVYLLQANPEHTYLRALDHDGSEAWTRDFGTWVSAHGFGTSPLVVDDKVIFCRSQQAQRLKPGQTPGTSEVIAVTAKDGKDLWRATLLATTACYSIPCLAKLDGQPDQLIGTNSGNGFYSINPVDGKLNWSTEPFKMRTVASVMIAGGLVFGSNGSGGGGNYTVAMKLASGVADAPTRKYEVRDQANYVPTPLVVDDLLFLFSDKGVVSCLDLQSGELHWQNRVGRGYSSSPVATGKQIYAVDQRGTVAVIAVNKEFKLLGKVELGETSRATPAISKNRIFFRTDSQLFAVGSDR